MRIIKIETPSSISTYLRPHLVAQPGLTPDEVCNLLMEGVLKAPENHVVLAGFVKAELSCFAVLIRSQVGWVVSQLWSADQSAEGPTALVRMFVERKFIEVTEKLLLSVGSETPGYVVTVAQTLGFTKVGEILALGQTPADKVLQDEVTEDLLS